MIGLLSFERTREGTTETMPLAPNSTTTGANNQKNYKLTRAATLLENPGSGLIVRIRSSSVTVLNMRRERVTAVTNAGSPSDFSQSSRFLGANRKD